MSRFISIITTAFLSACFVCCTQGELSSSDAVGLTLETENADYREDARFVHIEASGQWTISLKAVNEGDDISWAGLNKTEGRGNATVVMSYSYNGSEQPRSVNVCLSCGNQTVIKGFVQKGITRDEPEIIEVPGWMELPQQQPSLGYYNHSFRYDGKTYRNYSFGWSANNRLALWVAYPLCGFYSAKKVSRVDAWNFDPDVPVSQQANLTSSYRGSYDRGHQLPSADRLVCRDANAQTFYFTNMTPQRSTLNQNLWQQIEGTVNGWGNQSDTLYVVTGCVMSENPGTTTDASGNVCPLPQAYFKACLRYSRSGTQGWGGYTAIGIYVEHFGKYSSGTLSREMTMSITQLEDKLGYKLFVNLDKALGEDIAKKIKSQNPSDVKFWGI